MSLLFQDSILKRNVGSFGAPKSKKLRVVGEVRQAAEFLRESWEGGSDVQPHPDTFRLYSPRRHRLTAIMRAPAGSLASANPLTIR